jgi:hypothetical protein
MTERNLDIWKNMQESFLQAYGIGDTKKPEKSENS